MFKRKLKSNFKENGKSYGESQKVADRKTTEEQVDMLGLKETIDHVTSSWSRDPWGSLRTRDKLS